MTSIEDESTPIVEEVLLLPTLNESGKQVGNDIGKRIADDSQIQPTKRFKIISFKDQFKWSLTKEILLSPE